MGIQDQNHSIKDKYPKLAALWLNTPPRRPEQKKNSHCRNCPIYAYVFHGWTEEKLSKWVAAVVKNADSELPLPEFKC